VGAFDGVVALVTGASGNLGAVVARRLADEGAFVALPDRKPERLRGDFPEVGTGEVMAARCEITEPESVGQFVAAAEERFGRIDILVNAAGGFRYSRIDGASALEDWDQLYELNARSAFLLCRAVAPGMARRGEGAIVNVGSRAALAGAAGTSAYAASKAAVLRLTEALSAELKSSGVRVNCVLPGTIDTPQNRQAMPDADPATWVDPQALADVILFLCSPGARAIHGAALPVYGLG
jgi:NAD(P)-dependent dehydrogenase (short-subunit alcohol dehydrogenase family)